MIVGYARVSAVHQNLEYQIEALKKAGCEKIYHEKCSGSHKERPELEFLLKQLREGDVFIVYKLDRLGRPVKDLVRLILDFNSKGIDFISLSDNINTSTATGRFTFNLFASLAELERELILERTSSGLASARARGRVGGRPQGLSLTALEKSRKAAKYYKEGLTGQQIMSQLKIYSSATLYKYLKAAGVNVSGWVKQSKK